MVRIKKYDGTVVEFDMQRIKDTLERLNTDEKLKTRILDNLHKKIKEGMTTGQIYKIVFGMLKQKQRRVASKYSLKKAITELGPKGYNFEDFICRILAERGYTTKVRQTLNGEVITHEMDVVAYKNGEHVAVECKFHQNEHTYSPIQTALYVYARFLDIMEGYKKGKEKNQINKIMIATNTRFSPDARLYSKSKNMELLSWDYPVDGGIRNIVDKKSLYPITVLTKLSKHEKQMLLKKGIILVKDIKEKDVKPIVMKEIEELLREA